MTATAVFTKNHISQQVTSQQITLHPSHNSVIDDTMKNKCAVTAHHRDGTFTTLHAASPHPATCKHRHNNALGSSNARSASGSTSALR